jgi:DeoR family transcriptional regulator, glycerol-3-phosphate regulon repressor
LSGLARHSTRSTRSSRIVLRSSSPPTIWAWPTLFLFGGYLRRNDTAILSATAGGLGNRFKFDIAIFGASAIDRDGDVLAYDPLEVEFTREVIRASRQVIFVAQAEKFAGRAPHVVANLRDAAVLISNCDPRATLADPAALDRVRVIVVDDTGP